MSFAGLTYTSLFLASFVFSMTLPLARKIRPFASSSALAPAAPVAEPKFPQMLSFAIVSVPMWIAIYIASTRWSDYRHHGFDVLFGSLEGIVCALIGWSWYGVYSCRRGGVFKNEDVELRNMNSSQTELTEAREYDAVGPERAGGGSSSGKGFSTAGDGLV